MTSPAPDPYEAEVGDEMFMGQQAVLAEARQRLLTGLAANPDAQQAALDVLDGYMRELVSDQEDDEEDDDDN